MKYDVFVSYATEDQAFAYELVKFIEGQGRRCWIAPRDEVPGVAFAEAIDNAIAESNTVMVLCSKNVLASKWVPLEVHSAFEQKRHIVPIRLDGVCLRGEMRLLLGNRHWIEPNENGIPGETIMSAISLLPCNQVNCRDDVDNFVRDDDDSLAGAINRIKGAVDEGFDTAHDLIDTAHDLIGRAEDFGDSFSDFVDDIKNLLGDDD